MTVLGLESGGKEETGMGWRFFPLQWVAAGCPFDPQCNSGIYAGN